MTTTPLWHEQIYFGNSLFSWGMAALTAFAILAILYALQTVVIVHLQKLIGKAKMTWAGAILEALRRTKPAILALVAIFLASYCLSIPAEPRTALRTVAIFAFLAQAGLWSIALIDAWMEDYRRRNLTSNPAAVTSMSAVGYIAKMVVWLSVVLLALDNMGVNVTALAAGLGIGGIAVALAVQNILGDLLASMTIVVDKPFVVGDFVVLGEHMGSVEHIGLKTTRLRSISGEQLILSNGDLLSSRIRNFGRMFERRVLFTLNFPYTTPRDKLKAIPALIRKAVEAQADTRFERCHFKAYTPASLDFETVYFVTLADYNRYMDIQQAVNLQIHESFEREGIEFAYPKPTTIIVESRKDTQ